MVKERTLEHQQVYQYKVHLAKLALMVDAVPQDSRCQGEEVSTQRF